MRAADIDTWDDPNAHLLDGIELLRIDPDSRPPLTFERLVPSRPDDPGAAVPADNGEGKSDQVGPPEPSESETNLSQAISSVGHHA